MTQTIASKKHLKINSDRHLTLKQAFKFLLLIIIVTTIIWALPSGAQAGNDFALSPPIDGNQEAYSGYSLSKHLETLRLSNVPGDPVIDGENSFDAILEEYILTVNVNGSGSVTVEPEKTTYQSGEIVKLTATPAVGWSFVIWIGDNLSSDNPTTVTMDANKTITAYFIENQYLLTVNIDGSGSVSRNPDQQTYYHGDEVQLTATPEPGWTFTGWSGDLSGSQNPTTVVMDGNKNVTATFTAIEYNLTVNSTGSGTVNKDPDKTTYHYGDEVELTAVPDNGWHFESWSGDLSGSTNPASLVVNGNKTVGATFAENQAGCYTLVLTHNGQGSNPVANPFSSTGCAPGTYQAGESISLSDATPDTGWHITGWTGTSNNSSTASTNSLSMPASDHTAGVVYERDSVSLTINITGNGSVNQNPAGPYLYGDVVELAAVPDTDWYFDHWTGDLTGTDNPGTITLDGNKTVTAVFDQTPINCYSLTITHEGEGTDPVANPANSTDCPEGFYIEEEVISVSGAEPAIGWHLTGWTGTTDNTSTVGSNWVVMPADDHTVSAIYAKDNVTLTVNVSGNGTVNKSPVGPYLYGDEVELTAVPESGWHFVEWTGDLTGSTNPETIYLLGNKTVTAVFARDAVTLTVNSSGNGSVNKDPAGPYNFGDQVELTAVPENGWHFVEWTGDLTGSTNPDTILLDSNKTITAVFARDSVTLTVNVSGNGSVNQNPTGPYFYGDQVELTAIPDSGWHLQTWTGDLTGTVNPQSITLNGNKTVTAVFVIDSVSLTVNVSGNGSVSQNPTGPYEYGDEVELTAVPATGWHFSHWTGDLTGSDNPETILLNGNKTVTAVFEQNPTCYILTLSHDGQGTDPVASPVNSTYCPVGQYSEGEVISLSGALPDDGWEITGWTGTDNDTSPSSTNTLTMPGSNHTVLANYRTSLFVPMLLNGEAVQSGSLAEPVTENVGNSFTMWLINSLLLIFSPLF